MKRMIGTGLSLLLLTALTVPSAKAETKIDRQLQLTHPTRTTNGVTMQSPMDASTQEKTNVTEGQVAEQKTVTSEQTPNLSERDRIIQEYQTQRVIRDR
jgi:hypothetical protein